jgi:hypothetical protein
MSTSEGHLAETDSWSTTGLRRLARSIHQHRNSVGWLMAGLITIFAGVVCTTIRVRDSFLDATQLQVLVCGLMVLAATHLLVAFRVRSGKWHALAWASVVVVFICCVGLT